MWPGGLPPSFSFALILGAAHSHHGSRPGIKFWHQTCEQIRHFSIQIQRHCTELRRRRYFFGDPKIIADTLYKWTALKTSIDGLTVVQKFRWPLTGQLQLWWVKVPFLMLIKTYKNPWLELCGFFFLNSKFWNGQTSVHDTSMAKDVVYPGLHLPWCLHGLCPTLVWELGACRIPTCAGKHTLEIKEHSWKLRKRSCEVRVRCTCFVFDIFDFCPITNHLWHPVTVRCEVFTFCFEDRLWSTLYSPDTQQYTCIQRLSNVSGCNLEHRALKWR